MRIKIIVLLLLCSSFLNAQTTNAKLNTALKKYFKYSVELNTDSLVTYLYPRIFEIASKEEIAKAIGGVFKNPQISTYVDSAFIEKMYPIEKFSKGAFSKFTYKITMRMKFLDKPDSTSQQHTLTALKNKYGNNNVSLDAESYFKISAILDALAINDNYSNHKWCFLGIEKGNVKLNSIIPKEIINYYKLQK